MKRIAILLGIGTTVAQIIAYKQLLTRVSYLEDRSHKIVRALEDLYFRQEILGSAVMELTKGE